MNNYFRKLLLPLLIIGTILCGCATQSNTTNKQSTKNDAEAKTETKNEEIQEESKTQQSSTSSPSNKNSYSSKDYDEMIADGTCDWASECGDYYIEKNAKDLDELEKNLDKVEKDISNVNGAVRESHGYRN